MVGAAVAGSVLVLANAAGRGGTEGADAAVADCKDEVVVDARGAVAVTDGVETGVDDTAAATPARSQGFGGEGMPDDDGCSGRAAGRRWSGRTRYGRQ